MFRALCVDLVVAVPCLSACGKKGPPLPPLVKLPVAPADLTAVRRADTVELQFTVPSANTDNTRPANVARVDVYAFTGPATVSEADVLKLGTKVASVAVKAPRDPDVTFDPDDPEQFEGDVEPPEGRRPRSGRRGAGPGNADRAGSRTHTGRCHAGCAAGAHLRRRGDYHERPPRSDFPAGGRAARATAAAAVEA